MVFVEAVGEDVVDCIVVEIVDSVVVVDGVVVVVDGVVVVSHITTSQHTLIS